MAEFCFGLVTVYGEKIGPQDDVYGLPRLCFAGTLGDLTGLDDAIEFKTAILVDGRKGIESELAATQGLERGGGG